MPRKLLTGSVGAVLFIILLALQSVANWTVIDSILTGLRNRGPTGAFLTGILVSPLVPLVLAIASISFAYQGFKDFGNKRNEFVDANVVESGNSTAGGGSATATGGAGGSVTQTFVLGDLSKPKPD